MTGKPRLSGKVAIITGAAQGIGRATALLFAAEGSQVMVADINDDGARETVSLVKKAGGEASSIRTDVAKVADLEKMIAATVKTYGKLDVLYNHAGISTPPGVEDLSESGWQESLDVNLKAGVFATKYAIPEMRKAGGGSIIFTASISGLVGSPNSPTYSATKGGVVLVVKSLALKYATENIRVNCICPGPIDTPMLPIVFGGVDLETKYRKSIGDIPMGRLGRPEEIAGAALFLASDEASFVTGIALPVDGGFTAR